MKRILFILALVMSAMGVMAQESVKVKTMDGNIMAGTFVGGTDSTYTIKCDKNIRSYVISKYGTDTVVFDFKDISQVQMYGKVFVPINGKLVAVDSGKISTKKGGSVDDLHTSSNTFALPANPNEVIGKALKNTGGVSLAIGVPCLVTGSILMAVGMVGDDIGIYERSQITTAACILFPIGASLTIVGIPLHVHGKKIMTMNFNYTGNGVGVGVEF